MRLSLPPRRIATGLRQLGRGAFLGLSVLAAPSVSVAQSVDHARLSGVFEEPVTTAATGKPQRVLDVPANLTIVTAEEIRRSGLNNIPDILARVSGVDVLRWGAASADVGVRGYNQGASPRLLVLVNGRQVYSDHYAYTLWSAVPVQLSEIVQIEVVKGPNAALFGFNAVGGVVNIVTAHPLTEPRAEATLAVGSDGYRQLSLSASGRLTPKVGLRLSAGQRFEREYDRGDIRPTEAPFIESDPVSKSLAGTLMVQATPSTQVSLEGTRSFSRLVEFLPTNSYNFSSYDASSIRATVASETSFGLLEAGVYTNWLAISFRAGAIDPAFKPDVATTVAQASLISRIAADQTARVSVEYRRNEMDVFELARGTIGYDVFSTAAMWDWQALAEVELTAAVRLDALLLSKGGPPSVPLTLKDYDRNNLEAGFNFGIVWKPDTENSLRLTVARGVQTPSLVELGLASESRGLNYAGDPQLKSSVVTHAELGVSHELWRTLERTGEGNGGRATVTASVFWQSTSDVKSTPGFPSSLPPGPPYFVIRNGQPVGLFTNVGDSDAVGGEVDLRWTSPNGLRADVSYAHILIDDDFSTTGLRFVDPRFLASPIRFEGQTPRHKVGIGGGFDGGGWTFDARLTWQSTRKALRDVVGTYVGGQFDVVVPSGFGSSLSASYTPTSWVRLGATVTNPLGDRTTTPGLRTERRAFGFATIAF